MPRRHSTRSRTYRDEPACLVDLEDVDVRAGATDRRSADRAVRNQDPWALHLSSGTVVRRPHTGDVTGSSGAVDSVSDPIGPGRYVPAGAVILEAVQTANTEDHELDVKRLRVHESSALYGSQRGNRRVRVAEQQG